MNRWLFELPEVFFVGVVDLIDEMINRPTVWMIGGCCTAESFLRDLPLFCFLFFGGLISRLFE